MDTILIVLAAFSVLALYFILLHLQVYLVTIMKNASMLDDVAEIYRVLATENNPLYAGLVDERPEDKQDATAYPPGLEDDAASVLSELTEMSEPRVARDNEHSDEESEAEVPLAEIHRLKKRNSSGESSPHTQTEPITPVSLVPHTGFQTLDGVDVYAQKVRGTKDATYNVFESVGEAEVVTPPFLPKCLVIPMDLYIHRWSGGVQVWLFSADGWSELRAGDVHPVFSDRRFFIRRSEPPRWVKMTTYSRIEKSAMRFTGIRYRP